MDVASESRRVEFRNGHVADFEFVLGASDAFTYGNQTHVTMTDHASGYTEGIDTRYDVTLDATGANFGQWVDAYLTDRFGSLVA